MTDTKHTPGHGYHRKPHGFLTFEYVLAGDYDELAKINAGLLEALECAARALEITADYVEDTVGHAGTAAGIRSDANAARTAIAKAKGE